MVGIGEYIESAWDRALKSHNAGYVADVSTLCMIVGRQRLAIALYDHGQFDAARAQVRAIESRMKTTDMKTIEDGKHE